MAQDGIEERLHGVALGRHVRLGVAPHATAEEVGEIALVVVGAQLEEEIENLVDRLLGIDPGPVDLVDEHDRPQTLSPGPS